MTDPFSTRARLSRWIAAPVAAGCVVAWAMTLIAWFQAGSPGRLVELEHGCVTLKINSELLRDDPEIVPVCWLSDLPGYDWSARLCALRWLPSGGRVQYGLPGVADSYDASLPLWIPGVLCAAFAARAWFQFFQHRRGNVCRHCGYARQGLGPGVPCPECGRPPRGASAAQNR